MKNKIIMLLFVTIVPFFISINNVYADSCTKVNEALDKYNKVVKDIETIKCDSVLTDENSGQCIALDRERAYYLEKLFNYNENKTCSSIDLSKIIEENKDSCSNSLNSDVKNVTKTVMNFFYVIAPFLFLVFGGIDLTKLIVINDQKQAKKIKSDFVKRLTAFILIFFIPVFINLILSITGNSKLNNLKGESYYTCGVDVSKYQVKIIVLNNSGSSEKQSTKTRSRRKYSGSSKTSSGYNTSYGSRVTNVDGNVKLLEAADQVHRQYEEEKWYYSQDVRDDNTGALKGKNIEWSYNNPDKATCCATYVSVVLYVSGIIPAEVINRYGYNAVSPNWGVSKMLSDLGWIRIDNVNDLIPGDIVITDNKQQEGVDGHVEIFHGWDSNHQGLWSGAGSDSNIVENIPAYKDGYMIPRFRYAYRQP